MVAAAAVALLVSLRKWVLLSLLLPLQLRLLLPLWLLTLLLLLLPRVFLMLQRGLSLLLLLVLLLLLPRMLLFPAVDAESRSGKQIWITKNTRISKTRDKGPQGGRVFGRRVP